jgi:branched-chain amino acid transport system substrate-binding protein
VINSSQWNKDLDNAANKAFVAGFQKAYGRLPSLYASQGYDAAKLIASALKTVGGAADADAFRAALKKADFESVRGKFRFGSNHHPIQDVYMREVVKEGDVITNKIIGVAFTDHQDAYAGECGM